MVVNHALTTIKEQSVIVFDFDTLIKIFEEKVSYIVNEAVKRQNEGKKDPFFEFPEHLTRKQTAKILAVSLPTIDRWVREGKLKKYLISGSTRFKKNEVIRAKQLFI